MQHLTDEELLQRIGAGDEMAFKELFERYQVRLYNFILRTVGEDMAAEDVFQETFIRIARKAFTFQPRARAVTWIYRIAYNLSIDSIRRNRHMADFEEVTEELPGTDGEPFSLALMQSQRAMLVDALGLLSAPHRAVVMLSVVEERSHQEIADMLDIPVGTVKSRLHYALRKLKETLRPLVQDAW
jgi:RNA polymerase sigma-70 factor, ECF subfamily